MAEFITIPTPGKVTLAVLSLACNDTLYCITLHCIALHCIALHCIALHCRALQCIAVQYSAVQCSAGHCTARHGIAVQGSAVWRSEYGEVQKSELQCRATLQYIILKDKILRFNPFNITSKEGVYFTVREYTD